MLLSIVLLFLLITLNGFFAGSEIAFISLSDNKLNILKEKGDKKAKLILNLKEMPNKFLSTIQIGVSLASILSGVFASEAFATILTEWILLIFDFSLVAVKTFSMFFITMITSFLMLVFGELVPKRIAMVHPKGFSYLAVYPLTALAIIATPLVKILSFSTNIVLKAIKINPEKIEKAITEEEIRNMVNLGDISPIEKEMIQNIFNFDDLQVAEIMTHRTDIVAIDSEESFDSILSLISKERFTRYPVYEDNIDNIIGVIHLRELLRYIRTNSKEDFVLYDLLKEPYFVPDSKQTDELFRELQLNQTHMGIIIDEYGGTAGIITMENLIEVIMGDISDEYDPNNRLSDIIKLIDNKYIVDGSSDLRDLEKVLNIGLPVEDYDTVNGFIIGHLGRIPTQEDLESSDSNFLFNNYSFSIKDIDDKVISRVEIVKEAPKSEEKSSKQTI